MIKLGQDNYVFGCLPDLKLVLPPGTLKFKLKERSGELAIIFIKTKHGISEHYVVVRDGTLQPGVIRGSNLRGEKPANG